MGRQSWFTAAVDVGRIAYRVTAKLQWLVFLAYGLAIWLDWGGRGYLLLAFMVAVFVAWVLGRDMPKTDRSSDGSRLP